MAVTYLHKPSIVSSPHAAGVLAGAPGPAWPGHAAGPDVDRSPWGGLGGGASHRDQSARRHVARLSHSSRPVGPGVSERPWLYGDPRLGRPAQRKHHVGGPPEPRILQGEE